MRACIPGELEVWSVSHQSRYHTAQDSSTMLLALTLALRPLGPLQPARPATLAHRRAGPLIAQADELIAQLGHLP